MKVLLLKPSKSKAKIVVHKANGEYAVAEENNSEAAINSIGCVWYDPEDKCFKAKCNHCKRPFAGRSEGEAARLVITHYTTCTAHKAIPSNNITYIR